MNEPRHFGRHVPFLHLLGAEAGTASADVAEVRLPFRTDLTNSAGHLHGGGLMAALDFAMSGAARASDPEGLGASTIEMHTSFLRPAQGDLRILATCIQRGRSIAFCEARALDGDDKPVATASGTFKLTRRSAD